MALPSFYNTGTATVASGGTAVTGQGTAWLNSVKPGDRFGSHKGLPIRIASVNSNTSLTLAYAAPAALAQTAAAYEIAITPVASEIQTSVRALLETLQNGNLSALASQTGAADKVPYFTGAGAMAIATMTAAARTVLDDTSIDAMRETLMSGSGLGANTMSATNLDNISASGFYNTASPYDGAPTVGFYLLQHVQSSASSAYQVAYSLSGTSYFRRKQAGVWSSWAQTGLINMTVRSVSATHTFNILANNALIIAVGAGGGGGSATADAGTAAAAGGGGSGAVVWKQMSLASLASVSCTIGAGGAGTGGTTAVSGSGISLSAGGGTAGGDGVNTSAIGTVAGGSGGSAAGGELNISGSPGDGGFSQASAITVSVSNMLGGNGGSCAFGNGGRGGALRGGTSGGANGAGGSGFGSGGGGGVRYGFAATNGGGAGAGGAVIIMEYR